MQARVGAIRRRRRKQQNAACDHDTETEAQHRESLPVAGSGQVQQKRRLHQGRPANRKAHDAPDHPTPCRGRRPLRKERAQPQPDHRKGQKGWRAGEKVPPVALVAGNSQRDRIPRRCVECERQEGDRSSCQPNNKQCCVRPCRTLLVFRPHHSFALREAHLFLHGDPQPSYAEGHNLVLWAGFCESVGAAQTC